MSSSRPTLHDLQRMDVVLRSSGVGLWLNNMPLGDLVWSDITKAHFQLPAEARPTLELFYERLHEDDREQVREAIERAAVDDRPFDQVYRTVGPDGGEKWIHAVGRMVRDEAGEPRHFDGITLDITTQVLALQRLREFADTAPAMLWVTDASGACNFLSRGWTSFTGQSEAAGLGYGWLDMVHPDDRPHTSASFLAANERQEGFALEHRLRGADGGWHWVIDAGRPRIGPTGEFLGYVGSVTDIHDRRVAEDELRHSRDRYRQLLESIDEGFCIVQIVLDEAGRPADYRFIEMNPLFEQQTGLVQPLGRTARELVPDLESFWIDTYGDVALSQQSRRFAHGSQAMGRWFDVFTSPIGAPEDLHVAILFRDVSQQVQAERRLTDSEDRYRAFLANSSEGIWRVEFQPPVDTGLPAGQQVDAMFARGRFAECNQEFARLYELASPAEVAGRGLELVIDRRDRQARANLLGFVEAGYRAVEVEAVEHDRSGGPVWLASNFSGVVENGQLVRVWGTHRDITRRKRAELALMDADRRKDEFLATLAHELRNPLAPIRSAAELLRRRAGSDAAVVRHAELIGRQVSHLARMIDDLMDVSRVTRGKLELRLAPLVLQDVLKASVDNAQDALKTGEHPLSLSLQPEPVHLLGDEVRLVQVFLNLLTNAARYSAAGRPIAVSLDTEGAEAVVRIRDQGVGIAADQLARVFDLFFQGGIESERTNGGLGIGLSLVERLVELHRGTVVAHSAGLGQGSEFVVRLPLASSTDALATGAPEAPADAPDTLREPRKPRKILVVDDNRDAAETMAEVLRAFGYEVRTAYDGVEGLAQAEAHRPDVAVLDLGMPRLDGYGTCRALRASDWGKVMPILALTGWGQATDVERASQAGFDGHLVKPVSPELLVRTIEDILRQRQPMPAA